MNYGSKNNGPATTSSKQLFATSNMILNSEQKVKKFYDPELETKKLDDP